MAGTHRSVDADIQSYGCGLHPPLASASHQHEDKHLAGERLLHKTSATSHVFFRHEADGRPVAENERP